MKEPADPIKINEHISAYTQPTHLIFGTVKDIFSIKNEMRRLSISGDMVILFLSDPAVFATTQNFKVVSTLKNVTSIT